MDRRQFLAGLGVTGLGSLAGCSGGIWEQRRSPDDIEYALQSDRIFRERPVQTDEGLVLSYTYAVGDTGYRFQESDGDETVLFSTDGWFLMTTVNWLWERGVPAGWELDPEAFRIVVDGGEFAPLEELPRDIEWPTLLGEVATIEPHFEAGPTPAWAAQQGWVNFLFDVPVVESAPYYLRWDPSSPVDGNADPVYLTSTYGPLEGEEASKAES